MCICSEKMRDRINFIDVGRALSYIFSHTSLGLTMDPLSDVLSLLHPKSHLAASLDMGGEWSIEFPDQQGGIKCNAMVWGTCWLKVEGVAAPVQIMAGDVFLLPRGKSFCLATDLSLHPVAAKDIIPQNRVGSVSTINGGGDSFLISSRFELNDYVSSLLLDVLPPIVLVRGDTDDAAHLRYFIELIAKELPAEKAGSVLAIHHLSHLILMHCLRLYQSSQSDRVGWFYAINDDRIGKALSAMHGFPSRKWTLDLLAETCGMSRSVFARRFKAAVGQTPMDYLLRWRMLRAGDKLASSGESISKIAETLGYDSESAFSSAFKKVMGVPPRAYGRSRKAEKLPRLGMGFAPNRLETFEL